MLSLSLLGKMTLYGPASFLSKSGSESRQAPGNSSTVNLGIIKAVKEIKDEMIITKKVPSHLSFFRQPSLCVSGSHKETPLEVAEKQQVRFFDMSTIINLQPAVFVVPLTEILPLVPGMKSSC